MMTETLRELYTVLKEMVHCAMSGESEKILELNKRFDVLYFEIFPRKNPPDIARIYDNCRISCMMTASDMLEDQHEKFRMDARDRFSEISKP